MGDGRTVWPEKDEREKAWGPGLISARKPCEPTHDLAFTATLAKTRRDPGTGLVNRGATARRRHRRLPPPTVRDAGCHV